MKIAITGSSGFVGNFLVKYFAKKGISVIGIDINKLEFQNYTNFIFIPCDIRNRQKVFDIFKKEKITHVIHLAFLMKPQHDKKFEYDVDVNGSKNIFDAANSSKSVKQFIHFSSASIYGGFKDNKNWICEKQKPRPRDWAYAQNKRIVEDYYFNTKKHFKLVNFRMCTACGPSYFRNDGLVDVLAKAPIGILLDNKDTNMQFIHEDDVKMLVEKVINDNKIEGTYNLAPNSYACTKELCVKNKTFIPIPSFLFKGIISMLWSTRIISVSPTSVNLIANSIIISSEKLAKKYNYKFKYTTKEAFFDDYKKRKARGVI